MLEPHSHLILGKDNRWNWTLSVCFYNELFSYFSYLLLLINVCLIKLMKKWDKCFELFFSKNLERWIWLTLRTWPSVRAVVWWPTNDVNYQTARTGSRGKVWPCFILCVVGKSLNRQYVLKWSLILRPSLYRISVFFSHVTKF